MTSDGVRTSRPLTQIGYFVLLALAAAPLSDYDIVRSVWERTGGRDRVEAAKLYGTIRRLRGDGLIERAAGVPRGGPLGHRDNVITELGRRVLGQEEARIARLRRSAPSDGS